METEFFDSILNINLTKLKNNYLILKKEIGNSICAATIKANAYGIGYEKALTSLTDVGCNDYFVASINEAINIRKINDNASIYVFHGVKKDETQAFLDHNIIPVINSKNQLNIWSEFAKSRAIKLNMVLHFDTAMNRLGVEYSDFDYFYNYDYKMLNILYVMSHLSSASEMQANNNNQLSKFKKIIKKFPNAKYSLANSSGIFLGKDFHFDMVRAGVALYGVNPTPYKKDNPMLNIINLKTKIIDTKIISKDGYVGYGLNNKISKNTKIAIIPIGYADGYARILSNKAYCFIKGSNYPIIGNISMDLTIIDISNDKGNNINIGDYVELIGDNIKIDDLVKNTNLIPYEILTSLIGRYKVKYTE